jgi:hypothetical protein
VRRATRLVGLERRSRRTTTNTTHHDDDGILQRPRTRHLPTGPSEAAAPCPSRCLFPPPYSGTSRPACLPCLLALRCARIDCRGKSAQQQRSRLCGGGAGRLKSRRETKVARVAVQVVALRTIRTLCSPSSCCCCVLVLLVWIAAQPRTFSPFHRSALSLNALTAHLSHTHTHALSPFLALLLTLSHRSAALRPRPLSCIATTTTPPRQPLRLPPSLSTCLPTVCRAGRDLVLVAAALCAGPLLLARHRRAQTA